VDIFQCTSVSEGCDGAWQDVRQHCIYTDLQRGTAKIAGRRNNKPGKSQEYEIESTFSEDATSEIQDPAPTAHLRAPKRKRGKSILSYQEEMISLENKKREWLIKHEEENDEDLNFFRSLVPYMKQLPPTKKLFLRSQFQNTVADEISALQNNLLHLQPQV